jgi:uncharacterized protein HemX
MKRTMLMALFTILISAGLSAQNQTQTQQQAGQGTQTRTQTGNQNRSAATVQDQTQGQYQNYGQMTSEQKQMRNQERKALKKQQKELKKQQKAMKKQEVARAQNQNMEKSAAKIREPVRQLQCVMLQKHQGVLVPGRNEFLKSLKSPANLLSAGLFKL